MKTYTAGMAFGELALLYHVPRAATIRAKTDAHLYELDRQTFDHIVRDASARKHAAYEEFLGRVPIFSTMDTYERNKIADAITEEQYKSGDYVITQGDEGTVFYVIIEGEAKATKTDKPGVEEPHDVMNYKTGDYFGVLALLKHEPRAVNVIATSESLRLAKLDRLTFNRLLGPLDKILMRNMETYKEHM